MYDSEDENLIDTSRCIVKEEDVQSLENRFAVLTLPPTPTFVPVSVQAVANATKEDDDGDDDDDDDDYVESDAPKKKRKQRSTPAGQGGRQYLKAMDLQANELVEAIQAMHQRGATEEDAHSYVTSLQLDEKKIAALKTSMFRLMQLSNKTSSATEIKMMKYLSSLSNDDPDKQLENSIRAMSYQSLTKATTATEDAIVQAEMEVKRLKDNLKIHRFFLEVHPEKVEDRSFVIQFIHSQLTQIEQQRFQDALAKTSARKFFARRQAPSGVEIEI